MKRRYVALILALDITLAGCGQKQVSAEPADEMVQVIEEEIKENEPTDSMEDIMSKTIKIKAP